MTIKRYRDSDDLLHAVESPEALVRELRRTSMTPSISDAEFMKDMAVRVELTRGFGVRSYSATAFVNDLLSLGVIREE